MKTRNGKEAFGCQGGVDGGQRMKADANYVGTSEVDRSLTLARASTKAGSLTIPTGKKVWTLFLKFIFKNLHSPGPLAQALPKILLPMPAPCYTVQPEPSILCACHRRAETCSATP